MVSKTVFESVQFFTSVFEKAGVNSPKTSAELLVSFVLNKNRAALFLDKDESVSRKNFKKLLRFAKKRKKNEPIQYILGETEFYGHKFFVSPAVLIPRPETELLVEAVLAHLQTFGTNANILDIGTGSGIIPITIAKEVENVFLTAVDISESALTVADQNAKFHQVENKIKFLQSDMYLSLSQNVAKFDIIISNPPYINLVDMQKLDAEVASFEPENALFGGEDGLKFYRIIIKESVNFLNKEGIIFLEIGYNQAKSLSKFAIACGFSIKELIKDYNGFDRILILQKQS